MENYNLHLKYSFYILFPGGYRVRDINNDNTDIYIVNKKDLSKVYVATLFTLKNIQQIMENNNDCWFWASDMLILDNLKRETIYLAIDNIIKTDYLNLDALFTIAGKFIEVFESENITNDLL